MCAHIFTGVGGGWWRGEVGLSDVAEVRKNLSNTGRWKWQYLK